ncbi:MAG: DUF4397 domain-containing protein [Acidimicrobiia bacterium]|nr:DUF4397 domain-containing protein [Acidimicrobiia bacterium]MDH4306413.1 DUF4397 domain-containing protein [Acidimicrobiia bacterium]MDH5295035.1 DUF4397 domain-containing protein [Acidimicrobiia bacterium]
MKRVVVTAIAVLTSLTMALPAFAQEDARIHLIHGIPDTPVDVSVDGSNVIEGFEFGDTQDLSSFAGQTLVNLQVKVAGTEDVAIDGGDVALPASGNITVIAHLDEAGTPTLGIFTNDTSEIAAGEGRLTVRHTAAAPTVDVKADGAVAFAGLAPAAEASADLPVGTVSAEVVPAGADEPVVIGPADLGIEDGASLIVYAVGSLEGESLTVLTETITGLGSAPSAVNTGNSPTSTPVVPMLAGLAAVALAAAFTRKLVTQS